eukprot:scaffold954_cov173-Ochromonas_danica.AAC.7
MRIVAGVICLGQALLPNGSLTTSCMNRVCATSHLIHQLLLSYSSNTNATTTTTTTTATTTTTTTPLTATLVFSGGDVKRVGKTEAQAMMEYYYNNQYHQHHDYHQSSCSSSRMVMGTTSIILEEQSTNTIENFLFCQSILDNHLPLLEDVYIVTNDFHLPRSMLLSRALLHHPHNSRRIHGIAAPCSHTRHASYRPLADRPIDSNCWHLCEILDWEYHAVCNMNESLSKYGLDPLPQEWIEKALEEIRLLNCSAIIDTLHSNKNNTTNTTSTISSISSSSINLIELGQSFKEEEEKEKGS